MYTCSTDVCHLCGAYVHDLGDVYLCRNDFLIEVQMLAGKHHLIRGPQMPVSRPFASE